MWAPFSKEELINTIGKYNNSSAFRPDKLSWSYIKQIIWYDKCISKLIDIVNVCIGLGHWPFHFKTSTTVIISKPNKKSYNSFKSFHFIVLMNILGKLFEKMIRERLQFITISNNFIHLYQLDGLKHRLTTDAGVTLTHVIHSRWIKNLSTSTLAFDIVQFFPLLNHHLLSLIINKIRLDYKVLFFFKNYLVGKKTKYLWNGFQSPFCNINIGVGQESAFLPILSALYLSPIFHILEKWLNILKIPISIISFVDDGLFILQNEFISHSNVNLFCSYNVISFLLTKFGLVVEHGKTEVFHFSRSHGVFNLPSLDLSSLGSIILLPKNIW